ncbi:tetratricopeptide repeat protein 38-like [Brienomyrus brachyistius]|uniref:tetratricopeptide repeat protein 38-like n=1 Tax=Brienomyrus brachyistius TaxID=42636 RepID=UPI0020B180A5|nr:tetratricopeptide repeat protein 38-like [Brienomyrus brachyistius]
MIAGSFRDCKAWQAEGLPLSTTSDDACKLYDAILTQIVTWRNDESLGGIEGCLSRLKAADPSFVMGHVVSAGLELIGGSSSVLRNEQLARAVRRTLELAQQQDLTPRERLHTRALEQLSRGCLSKASDLWDEILVSYPTDMLAIKFAQVNLFFLGYKTQMRDTLARVLPHWKPHMPLYSYLKGLYAFGLLETNFYDKAEKLTKEALTLTPDDAWSVHTMAHVHHMRAELDQGLRFMEANEKDWKGADMLASHNYWHWALYHIEKGEHEAALKIYDAQVAPRCMSSGAMLPTVDCCSMLYRLEMEGMSVKERWQKLFRVTQAHMDDHVLLFNDLHFLMASLGAKEREASHRLLGTLQELAEDPGEHHLRQLARPIGVPMCQALVEYDCGNCNRAVELLLPIRYRFQEIGGSDAQRDVLDQLLIHAAMKSEEEQHHKLARCLLTERDAAQPNSPLTHRLIQRASGLQR